MDSIIRNLSDLTQEISQDRQINTDTREFILASHTIGDGLVEKSNNDDTDNETDRAASISEEHQGDPTDAVASSQSSSIQEDCKEAITWLNNLGESITSLHRAPGAGEPSPCPNLAIEPRDFQYAALRKIEKACSSPTRAVMIADPPGLGKTLPAMMAIVKDKFDPAIRNKLMFSVVVGPASCLDQWRHEFERFFTPGTVSVFVLTDSNVSPLELVRYDVVITSYTFVMSQFRKLKSYISEIKNTKTGNGKGPLLERPGLPLFADIFYNQEMRFPYLVLDEINAAKNPESITFAAVQELQHLARSTIMLTGSPLDNTWVDLFAFMQLVGNHSIDSMSKMVHIFSTTSEEGRILPPTGKNLRRLVQVLNAFIIRRPAETVNLPTLYENTVTFDLSPQEADASNDSFRKYRKVMNINAAKGRRREGTVPWMHLTNAMQSAYHPMMRLIMRIAQSPLSDNDQTADILFEAADIAAWAAWRDKLKEDDNWRSTRIVSIIDAFNQCRDIDPDCSVLIFEDSVYFLDIVEIAFTSMSDPVECLRYDGREVPERRSTTLHNFEQTGGQKVMLISRSAGGVGLNITSANVVILCSPWWKQEWETQAIKRAHRTGQRRDVTAIRIIAGNCELDLYKGRTRDRKHVHNSQITDSITRKDGIIPEVWNDLE